MWEIDVTDQSLTFVYSLILGVILCAIYDIFRALRRAVTHSKAAVFAEDILFWLISAFLTFMFLMGRTGGGIRGYVLIAALIGFFALRLTLSRFIVLGLSAVISFWVKIHRAICGYSQRILEVICRFFERIGGFLVKKFKTAAKRLKKLLKSRGKLLYTETNSEMQK